MKKAVISVFEKSGIVELAKKLSETGFEILTTSGTAKLLSENGLKITLIENYTGVPEMLGGRVKTLHPSILGGILADKMNEKHISELTAHSLSPIEVVVVNLYPFKDTISKPSCTLDEAIEQIDIGGVTLIRAAAKNYQNVSVLTSPSQYEDFVENLKNNKINSDYNFNLAADAMKDITKYDLCISNYFLGLNYSDNFFSELFFKHSRHLRYGENPHQKANLLISEEKSFDSIFQVLHGKELSYNNILDIDAAYNLISEFTEPTCAIIKHTNPCGVSSNSDLKNAFLNALACDNISAFGGIIIFNRKVNTETALEADKIFSEIIIAPDFDESALSLLLKKKNRRLVKFNQVPGSVKTKIRTVTGGLLIQEEDLLLVNESEMKVVTKRKPLQNEMLDMIFAMKVAKHVKSNSIVYVKDLKTLGIGCGQPSRVDSSRIAAEKAKSFGIDLKGSVVASDAFFPFPDGVLEAAKAGASCVIQPGGSVRDDEVIQAADKEGLSMVFTGIRHFRH